MNNADRILQPRTSQLVEIEDKGFIPDEEVGITTVIGNTDASHDRTDRALIDSAKHPGVREAVLVSRVSGTWAVRRIG